jgi:hypothetical protein
MLASSGGFRGVLLINSQFPVGAYRSFERSFKGDTPLADVALPLLLLLLLLVVKLLLL